jgi:hypothetical protein
MYVGITLPGRAGGDGEVLIIIYNYLYMCDLLLRSVSGVRRSERRKEPRIRTSPLPPPLLHLSLTTGGVCN